MGEKKGFATWLLDCTRSERNRPRFIESWPRQRAQRSKSETVTQRQNPRSPSRNRVILELLYGGGLRASELAGLNLGDFREVDAVLVRGKGKKERMVIIGEYAQAAIRTWLPVRKKLLAIMKFQTDPLLFSVGTAPQRGTSRRAHHRPDSKAHRRKKRLAGLPSAPA